MFTGNPPQHPERIAILTRRTRGFENSPFRNESRSVTPRVTATNPLSARQGRSLSTAPFRVSPDELEPFGLPVTSHSSPPRIRPPKQGDPMTSIRLAVLSMLCLVATGCCCGGFGGGGYGASYGGGGCSSGACGAGPVGYNAPIGATASYPVGTTTAGVIGSPVIGAPATASAMPIESLPPY